jgi:hypothetical protein
MRITEIKELNIHKEVFLKSVTHFEMKRRNKLPSYRDLQQQQININIT